ncbi:MAG: sugar transferase [Bacteroidales bacterium]|nr:sugar transferase [Bacteroidales bacterium]
MPEYLNKKPVALALRYLVCDYLAAALAWALLFVFRKACIESGTQVTTETIVGDANFWLGTLLLPVAWCCLYAMIGAYKNVYRKARLKELAETAVATIIGVVVIFFLLMLDDQLTRYAYYYLSFCFLLVVHFVLTYLPRLVLTTRTVKKIHRRELGFPTLLVGSGDKALETYRDIDGQEVYSGESFVGYVSTGAGGTNASLDAVMPYCGTVEKLSAILPQVEEVIIATEEGEPITELLRVVNCRDNLIVKIRPSLRDIIYGSVKATSIFHSPLITLNTRLMSEWQYSFKRLMDIFISLLAMVLLSPVYLITAIIVKCTSPGPVFYAQERIGQGGKPFKMHKFRSMYVDAEASGPALSSDNDPRITPFGRFMRKVRLDEIPQFYNVLRGTMSLVGPRPERQYYIDKIVELAPEYALLQRVKPGITSWGQVKFGYAENVDEMIERMRYDLLYLENMSIATDVKILLYTVIIILQGRGK